jgi:outer membrane lipoprotein-sorting protein
MKKTLIVLITIITTFPILSHSYTVQQMRDDVKAYLSEIQSIQADFSITIHGTGNRPGSDQSGKFNYNSSSGTTVEYLKPMQMKVDMRENGALYINGEKKTGLTNTYQPGDIFFDYYMANYDLKIKKEDTNYVYLIGYEPTQDINKRAVRQKVLVIRFNKTLKVIDSISYLGNGNNYPYYVDAQYVMMQGIPIMTVMNMRVAAFSVSVSSVWKLENVVLIKR